MGSMGMQGRVPDEARRGPETFRRPPPHQGPHPETATDGAPNHHTPGERQLRECLQPPEGFSQEADHRHHRYGTAPTRTPQPSGPGAPACQKRIQVMGG